VRWQCCCGVMLAVKLELYIYKLTRCINDAMPNPINDGAACWSDAGNGP